MKVGPNGPAPELQFVDIRGNPLRIPDLGRRTLLSFFRDAACPFCNLRVYQLTQQYGNLSRMGLNVVAVFASDEAAVKRFVARAPRPFPVVADPSAQSHRTYGIRRSLWGKFKALFLRFPDMIRGMRLVGLGGLQTGYLMPADFLIDEQGNVVEAYYGTDIGDRIAFERIELFLARGLLQRMAQEQAA